MTYPNLRPASSDPSLRWQPDRRDFLKASAAALFGLAAGCRSPGTARGPALRFGLLTDFHYADANPSGTRYYRESLGKVREAVMRLREERVEFLGVLGDLKDMAAGEPDTKTLSYLVTMEDELKKFGGPLYHVLGNHDMDNLSKAQVLAAITNTGVTPNRSSYASAAGACVSSRWMPATWRTAATTTMAISTTVTPGCLPRSSRGCARSWLPPASRSSSSATSALMRPATPT